LVLWRVAKRELTGSVRTPEEQTEFIKVFSDLLEQTYVNKIESYNNDKFIYLNERIDEPYAEVGRRSKPLRERNLLSTTNFIAWERIGESMM
jgi:MlaC protein